MTASARADTSTRTVERALSLLAAVCEHGQNSMALADAARQTGLSASTALRLLRTLEAQGFVRKDEAGYRPGSRIIQLGAQALGNHSLVELAAPVLKRLVTQAGESAYLAVPATPEQGIYIAVAEGTHSVRHTSWVGRSIPLEGTATGAVLNGVVAKGHYVVVNDGVEPDVTAIAAPVLSGGRIVAALSVIAPSYRLSREQARCLGELIAREARSMIDATDTGHAIGHAADRDEDTA